jgi:hypothetical protein
VIQRFEGRPEQEHLSKLLHKEDLIQSAAQAAQELNAALAKLAEAHDEKRFRELAAIAEWGPDALTEDQRIEFKRLSMRSLKKKPSP